MAERLICNQNVVGSIPIASSILKLLMFPIIIKNSRIPKIISLFMYVKAITLWPFIIFRDEGNELTIRHESIHIKQQTELLVIFFYILYAYDFVVGLIKHRDFFKAYTNIRFEQEAYQNQADKEYLSNRERWAWTKYSLFE